MLTPKDLAAQPTTPISRWKGAIHQLANCPEVVACWDKAQAENDRSDRLSELTPGEKAKLAGLPATLEDESIAGVFRVEGIAGLFGKCEQGDPQAVHALQIIDSRPVWLRKLSNQEVDAILTK